MIPASLEARKTLRLTTRGRKSGQPRSVTIWFVIDGPRVGLGTLRDDRNWVRNARRTPDVELEIAGERFAGRLREVAEPEDNARIRAAMARKYWPARILSWFGAGQRFNFQVGDLRRLGGTSETSGGADGMQACRKDRGAL